MSKGMVIGASSVDKDKRGVLVSKAKDGMLWEIDEILFCVSFWLIKPFKAWINLLKLSLRLFSVTKVIARGVVE